MSDNILGSHSMRFREVFIYRKHHWGKNKIKHSDNLNIMLWGDEEASWQFLSVNGRQDVWKGSLKLLKDFAIEGVTLLTILGSVSLVSNPGWTLFRKWSNPTVSFSCIFFPFLQKIAFKGCRNEFRSQLERIFNKNCIRMWQSKGKRKCRLKTFIIEKEWESTMADWTYWWQRDWLTAHTSWLLPC